MSRSKYFYPAVLILFAFGIWLISYVGMYMFPHEAPGIQQSHNALSLLKEHLKNPLAILLLQILLIIGTARIFGLFFRRLGQPLVIGEIIAGIALGPSLLGWMFPETAAFIFPKNSLGSLGLVSQFGLILFMFLIGMELDIGNLKSKVHSAIVISHSSIIFPFLLGMLLALFLYPRFVRPDISFFTFALFMGIAMSITAFPVLARILQDHGLTSTKIGSLVLVCAAADDVTAWSILAVVLAIARSGDIFSGLMTVGLALVYIAFMYKLVAPLLKRYSEIYVSRENLSRGALTAMFLFLFGSAFLTEIIGIHALFGAFLAGVIMPSGQNIKELVAEKIRDFSMLVLLPLFFAFTGLRTSIGLINTTEMWMITALVIGVAVTGKMGGSSLAAKLTGQSLRDSLAIGALMNTRGLMELIVLNIGYDLGILSSEIFSIMVIMALATTAIAGPMLNLIWKIFPEKEESLGGVMISYATEKSGKALANLSSIIFPQKDITMLHLITGSSASPGNLETQSDDLSSGKARYKFQNQIRKSVRLPDKIKFIIRPAENILQQIQKEVEREQPEILLAGSARSLFTKNIFGGLIRQIFAKVKCHVGVFIAENDANLSSVLVLTGNHRTKMLDLLNLKSLSRDSHFAVMDLNQFQASQSSLEGYTFLIVESEIYEKLSGKIRTPALVIRIA